MRPYSTLGEALERYGREVSPHKKSVVSELCRIRVICRDPLAKQPLVSISSADIASWRNSMAAQGLSPSTIRNRFAVVSKTFQMANREWGLRCHNPIRGGDAAAQSARA